MIHRAFTAMGTSVEVWVEDEERFDLTVRVFEEIEGIASRFRPDSELAIVNRSSLETMTVSRQMGELLRAATDATVRTAGLVDIGIGAVVSGWGYDKTFNAVTDRPHHPGSIARPNWSFDDNILCKSPSTLLDLGGIAKGWTCDLVVERGLCSVVSAGGDIRSNDSETLVPVLDPWNEPVGRIRLGVGALATSSITNRRWKVGNSTVSHLVDPRTLAPTRTPVLSATVVAATATEAEIGAKAVLLHGEDGIAWADEMSWISSALVVWHDGSVYGTTGVELAA